MSTYAYSGYDAAGAVHRGWIDAPSPKRARLLLAGQGVLTESLRPVSERIHGGLPDAQRESFYREAGVLLQAGLPLEQALGILMKSADAALALSAAGLRERIREGARVAEAFMAVSGSATPFEHAALVAAERSGTLSETFLNLAASLERRRALREQFRGALTYPLFVCLLGLLLMTFMAFVLAPRALAMVAESGDGPPVAAFWVVGAMRAVLIVMAIAGVTVLPFLRWMRHRWRLSPALRIRFEKRCHALPGLQALLSALWASRFAAGLAMLSRAGGSRVESLALAGAASGSVWIAREARLQAEAVRQGRPMSQAVEAIAPLRQSLSEWTRIGESGGCLDELLAAAAPRLQSEYEQRLNRAMRLLEPLLILLIGAFVLAVALAVLTPALSLSRSLAY